MPISTMLNGLVEQVGRAREQADLGGDLGGAQVADQAHLAGQAEGAAHRAADLRRDAKRLRGRVGNEDRLDLLAVGQVQHELLRAVFRDVVLDDVAAATSRPPARPARSSWLRFVICAKSVTPRFQIHW